MQILAKGIESENKGLSLTVDLGDLPHMEANKHLEDPFSSDNAEVIDITNTDVIPETPDIKPSSP